MVLISADELRTLISDAVITAQANLANKPPSGPVYINSGDAIKMLNDMGINLQKQTLYNLTSTTDIPHKKIGKALAFDKNLLTEWADKRFFQRRKRHKKVNEPTESATL